MAQSIKLGDDVLEIFVANPACRAALSLAISPSGMRIGRAIGKSGNFDDVCIAAALGGAIETMSHRGKEGCLARQLCPEDGKPGSDENPLCARWRQLGLGRSRCSGQVDTLRDPHRAEFRSIICQRRHQSARRTARSVPTASYKAASVASSHRAGFLAQSRYFVNKAVFSVASKFDLVDQKFYGHHDPCRRRYSRSFSRSL